MRNLIRKILSEERRLLIEAKFEDVAVWPAKGIQRGTTETAGKSYDIMIGNPDVIRKMAKTPMGYAGKAYTFAGEGPNKGLYGEISWDANTSQWDVWKKINYIIVTKDNEVHWYNGKIPGGSFGVQKTDSGEVDKDGIHQDIKTGQKYKTSTPKNELTDLKIKGFGYKVYKALLFEPNLGYIVTNKKSSTDTIRERVYSQLIKDGDFVWIATGNNPIENIHSYDKLIIINPKHSNVQKVKQAFESENKGSRFYYSKNFPD